MCQIIINKYGYGPTEDKIRAAWSNFGYIIEVDILPDMNYVLK